MSFESMQAGLSSAFEWVWRTSLAATVLAGMVWVAQSLMGRRLPARWSYALWFLVLARLLMPTVPPSLVSVSNLARRLARPQLAETSNPLARDSGLKGVAAVAEGSAAVSFASEALALKSPGAARARWLGGGPEGFSARVLAWAWALGMVGYLGLVLILHGRLARCVRRERASADPHMGLRVEECKALLGLRGEVRVVETAAVETPALFGVFRPCLLMPRKALRQLGEEELRLVVLHELVHLRRRDLWLNWLCIGVQAAHWFNPTVWWALRRLRAERELVCDAVVLGFVAGGARRAYGETLLKLAQGSSESWLVPSFAPVVNRSFQLERRISMIIEQQPGSVRMACVAVLALAVLGCLTFTRAAERDKASPSEAPAAGRTEAAAREEERQERMEDAERRLAILREHLMNQQRRLKDQQAKVDALQAKLNILPVEADGSGAARRLGPDAAQPLEVSLAQARAQYHQLRALYQQLTNMARVDLRGAITTALPDAQLGSLLDALANAEQKLAQVSGQFADSHPEVLAIRRVEEKIRRQIEERLDGILQGLKVRVGAQKAQVEALELELNGMEKRAIQSAIEGRPYFDARRELENLRYMEERIRMRLLQEEVDAKIPKE